MSGRGRPLTQEQKDKMAAGRRRAALEKRAASTAVSASPPEDQALPLPDDVEDQSMPTGLGYGSGGEPDEGFASEPVADPTDPFQVWLLALDADTKALFTLSELKQEFLTYWEKARQEQKERKKKLARDLALSTARSHLGLLPKQTVDSLRVAQLNAKPVSMMIELPPAMDDGRPPDVGLRIDGKIIEHGRRWHGTYGEAASIREMLYRLGQHELLFKGVGTKYRSWMMNRALGNQTIYINQNGQ